MKMAHPIPTTRILIPMWAAWLPGVAWVMDGEKLNADDVSESDYLDWGLILYEEDDDG
jgi:hypothetical protein